ncbi:MAG: hypothetical protein WCS09_23160 [Pseudomonadota bacterium]|jgi:hypothetical protein
MRSLLTAILDADQRTAQAVVARYQGEVVSTPAVPLPPGIRAGHGVIGAHGYFDELYRLWVRRSNSTHVSRNEAEVWLRRLAEFTRTDPSAFMETVDKPLPVARDVARRRQHFTELPRSKVMVFKDHWLAAAERYVNTGAGPRMSAKTVRKGLSMLPPSWGRLCTSILRTTGFRSTSSSSSGAPTSSSEHRADGRARRSTSTS